MHKSLGVHISAICWELTYIYQLDPTLLVSLTLINDAKLSSKVVVMDTLSTVCETSGPSHHTRAMVLSVFFILAIKYIRDYDSKMTSSTRISSPLF